MKEWIKTHRTMALEQIFKTVNAKLRGHYQYYGVTDNTRENPQSFARAERAISLLAKEGVSTIVSTTFNYMNYVDLDYVTKHVKELGAHQITYSLTSNIGRARENQMSGKFDVHLFKEQCEKAKRKYMDNSFFVNYDSETKRLIDIDNFECGRGYTQLCIRENGDVSPCIQFDFVYGNLLRENPETIFNYKRIMQFKNLPDPNISICGSCNNNNECLGCAATAWSIPEEECLWKRENILYINKLLSIKKEN